MSEQTHHYQLPYLIAAQAQKHVTHNEALRMLDAFTNLSLKDLDLNNPPASPQEGDAYTIGFEPEGEWANHAHDVAHFVDGGWYYLTPFSGLTAYAEADGLAIIFNGEQWESVSSDLEAVPSLGINTQADSANKLAVKSDNVLFATDDGATEPTGDVRIAINKSDESDTNTLLFQTGYSGRAELGCTGSDAFRVKVSPDGAAFKTALEIDPTTGNVGMGASPFYRLDVWENEPAGISRLRIGNSAAASSAGAAIVAEAGGKVLQFLQYYSDAAYLTTSGRSFYFQATGASAELNLFAGSIRALHLSETKAEVGVPFQLKNYTVSDLPSPAIAGAGAMVFVSDATDGAVSAFSDGAAWRRTTDRQIIT